MSRGQRPRTRAYFPRMKIRGHARRGKREATRIWREIAAYWGARSNEFQRGYLNERVFGHATTWAPIPNNPTIFDTARRLAVDGILIEGKTRAVGLPWSPIGHLGAEATFEIADETRTWSGRPVLTHRFATVAVDINNHNRSAIEALFADITPCTCEYGDHLPAGNCAGAPTNPETHTS
jgi:hypothetical protein